MDFHLAMTTCVWTEQDEADFLQDRRRDGSSRPGQQCDCESSGTQLPYMQIPEAHSPGLIPIPEQTLGIQVFL